MNYIKEGVHLYVWLWLKRFRLKGASSKKKRKCVKKVMKTMGSQENKKYSHVPIQFNYIITYYIMKQPFYIYWQPPEKSKIQETILLSSFFFNLFESNYNFSHSLLLTAIHIYTHHIGIMSGWTVIGVLIVVAALSGATWVLAKGENKTLVNTWFLSGFLVRFDILTIHIQCLEKQCDFDSVNVLLNVSIFSLFFFSFLHGSMLQMCFCLSIY